MIVNHSAEPLMKRTHTAGCHQHTAGCHQHTGGEGDHATNWSDIGSKQQRT